MKKFKLKFVLPLVALVALGVVGMDAIFSTNTISIDVNILLANVEALAENGEKPSCMSGGKGSSTCSHSGSVVVLGNSVTYSCSIECNYGYYACCNLSCSCVEV